MKFTTLFLGLATVCTLSLTACGSDGKVAKAGGAGGAALLGAPVPDVETEIEVALSKTGPFSIEASKTTAPAGKISLKITSYDKTKVLHEVVVTRTNTKAKALAASKEEAGMVDETGVIAEQEDVEDGQSMTMSLFLPAGHYVVMCNKPAHHAGGMYFDLDVT